MKISFLCFDLSNNSLGRVALLARALARHHQVELIGPARGNKIWFPLEDLELPVKSFTWKRYPAFIPELRRMIRHIDGDVIFACKLFPTSFGVGILKRFLSEKPLIVDIDDWELGFFYHSGFWGKLGRSLNFSNPNGLPYTWFMERLTGLADAVTVSNRFLEKKFSGKLLHHCRDTAMLNPEKFDAAKEKEKLNLGNKKVVMFLGTPRPHKGVDDLFSAFLNIQDPDIHLVIVGADDPSRPLGPHWEKVKDRVTVLPKIPFSRLPEHLSAADVVAVPQRATTDTMGQMPAKIFDAMAMAKPVISTRVSDIPEVLDGCGYLVNAGDTQQLADMINYVFQHPEEASQKAQQAREKCMRLYDIKVLEQGLLETIDKVVQKT